MKTIAWGGGRDAARVGLTPACPGRWGSGAQSTSLPQVASRPSLHRADKHRLPNALPPFSGDPRSAQGSGQLLDSMAPGLSSQEGAGCAVAEGEGTAVRAGTTHGTRTGDALWPVEMPPASHLKRPQCCEQKVPSPQKRRGLHELPTFPCTPSPVAGGFWNHEIKTMAGGGMAGRYHGYLLVCSFAPDTHTPSSLDFKKCSLCVHVNQQ